MKENSKKSKRFYAFIISAILIFIASVRYGMGTDYFTYLEIFSGINNFKDYNYLEPGFRIVVSFFKTLGFRPEFLFFVFSTLTIGILYKTIIKYSDYPSLTLYLYLTIFYTAYVLNGMRQALVMSIFLYSIDYIISQDIKKVLIITLVAMSLHSTGILILISYLFVKSNVKMSKNRYIILVALIILLFFTSKHFSPIIIRVLPKFLSSKLMVFLTKFDESINVLGLLQRLFIIVPFIFYYNELDRLDDKFEGLFKIYFLGFIIYGLFSFQVMFATRLNMFFRIVEIILFGYIFKLNLRRSEKIFIFVAILIWSSAVYFSILNNVDYNPFISFFNR